MLQRTPRKSISPEPSTLHSIVIVRFCAFAPPGSPLDQYTLLSLLRNPGLVEMPSGGLTALSKTIKTRPDEVKRVVRALQTAKSIMLRSRERTLHLITRVLRMDNETAADTYKLVESNFNDTGIPSPEGMANIVKAIKAEGRFTDRNVSFEEVADPRFAIEVAKELGYKVP